MAGSQDQINILIEAHDKATAMLRQVQGELSKLSQSASSTGPSFAAMSAAMATGTVAANAVMGAIRNLSGAFSGAVGTTASFGQSMSNLRAFLPDADFARFGGELQSLAMKLGKDYPLSAAEAGRSMELLAQKGIPAEAILNGAAESVVKLSSATGADLVTATGIAAAAMDTFGLGAADMDKVTNLMTGAMIRGGVSATDYGFAMKAGSAAVALAGGSIEDASIAIAAMAKAGIEGSDAGTSLKTMYLNLIPTTKGQVAVARELGLVTKDGASIFFDASGKVKSYEQISAILADKTKHLTQEQKLLALETLFGSDAIRAAAISARFGAGEFGNLGDQIRQVDAGDIASKRLDSLKSAAGQLGGSVETLSIMLMGQLAPAFQAGVQFATEFVNALIDEAGGLDLTGMVDGIKTAIAGMSDVFYDAGQSVSAWTDTVGREIPIIGPLVQRAGQVVGSALTAMAAIMRGDARGAIAALKQSFSDIGPTVDAASGAISNLSAVITPFVPAIEAVVIAFSAFRVISTVVGLVAGLSSAISGMGVTFAAAGGGIAGIVALLGGPVTLVVAAVALAIGALAAAWINNWGDIQGITSSAVSAVGSAMGRVGGFVHDVGEWFGQLPGMLESVWEDLKQGVSDAWSAMSDAISSAGDGIVSAASDLWSSVVDATNQAGDDLTSSVSEAWDGLTSAISDALSAIGDAVINGWESFLTEPTRNALADLGDALSEAWGVMVGLVASGMGEIGSAVDSGWQDVVSFVSSALDSIASSVSSGWDAITSAVGSAMDAIGSAVSAGWDAIASAVAAAMVAVSSAVEAGWAVVSSAVLSAMEAIGSAIAAGWDAAVSAVSGAMGQILSAVESVGSEVVGAVSNFMSSAVSTVSSFAGEAWSAAASVAANFVEGMREGINSRIASIAGAAAAMVRAAIGSAEAAQESHSPSRKMQKVGEDFVAGFVMAIEQGQFGEIVQQKVGEMIAVFDEYQQVNSQIAQTEQEIKAIREDASAAAMERATEMIDITSEEIRLRRELALAERDLLPVRQELKSVQRDIRDIERLSLPDQQKMIENNTVINRLKLEENGIERQMIGLDRRSKEYEALNKQKEGVNQQVQALRLENEALQLGGKIAADAYRGREASLKTVIDAGERELEVIKNVVAMLDAEQKVFKASEDVISNATNNEIALRQRWINVLKDEKKPLEERIQAGYDLIDQMKDEGKLTEEQAKKIKEYVKEQSGAKQSTDALGKATDATGRSMDRYGDDLNAAGRDTQSMISDTQGLTGKLQALDGVDPKVIITENTSQVGGAIGSLSQQLAIFDTRDPVVNVTATGVTQLQGQLNTLNESLDNASTPVAIGFSANVPSTVNVQAINANTETVNGSVAVTGAVSGAGLNIAGNVVAANEVLAGNVYGVHEALSGNIYGADESLSGGIYAATESIAGLIGAAGITAGGALNVGGIDAQGAIEGSKVDVDNAIEGSLVDVENAIKGDEVDVDDAIKGDEVDVGDGSISAGSLDANAGGALTGDIKDAVTETIEDDIDWDDIFSGVDFNGAAAGGHIRRGSPTIVGELGRELFVPDTSGLVIPNGLTEQILGGNYLLSPDVISGASGGSYLAGGGEVHLHVTVTGNTLLGDAPWVAQEIARVIQPELTRVAAHQVSTGGL